MVSGPLMLDKLARGCGGRVLGSVLLLGTIAAILMASGSGKTVSGFVLQLGVISARTTTSEGEDAAWRSSAQVAAAAVACVCAFSWSSVARPVSRNVRAASRPRWARVLAGYLLIASVQLGEAACEGGSAIGDAFCDTEYNVAECAYDGGDCCESTCDDTGTFFTCGTSPGGYDNCIDPSVPTPLPSPVPSAVPTPRPTGYAMDDSNINTAVAAWLADATAAEATYGHISTWETGGGDGHVVVVFPV